MDSYETTPSGLPKVLLFSTRGAICMEESPRQWICTLLRGHECPHIAGLMSDDNGPYICAIWE